MPGEKRDRLANQSDCRFVPSTLMRDQSEQVERPGMIGMTAKNIAIDLFRLAQPAGLVELKPALHFLVHSAVGHMRSTVTLEIIPQKRHQPRRWRPRG
jgi:hypothetical protein